MRHGKQWFEHLKDHRRIPKLYVREQLSPLIGINVDRWSVPDSLDEAYALIKTKYANRDGFGDGWKLGGTTVATRQAFGVDDLYFGMLHTSEILSNPKAAPGQQLFEIKGEAELALRCSPKVANLTNGTQTDHDALISRGLFDAWCVALEMPSSPILNLVEAGVNALVADRCAAGCLILSTPKPYEDKHVWNNSELTILQNDKVIAVGNTDKLLAPANELAAVFIRKALHYGFTIKPGQWIATGGLTPCVPLIPGAQIKVIYQGDTVLRFQVKSAENEHPT